MEEKAVSENHPDELPSDIIADKNSNHSCKAYNAKVRENKSDKNDSSQTVVIKDKTNTDEFFHPSKMINSRTLYADSQMQEPFVNSPSIVYTGYAQVSGKLGVSVKKEANNEETQEQLDNGCTDVKVCKQEYIEEIVNLKEEIEGTENALDGKIVRYDMKESLVIDIKDKYSAKGIAGLDISIKQEVDDPAYNKQNGVEPMTGINKNNNRCEQNILDSHDNQNELTTVSNGNVIGVSSMLSTNNGGNFHLGKDDQIYLEPSVLFTFVSMFPKNELNKESSDTKSAQSEGNVTNIDVTCLDNKDLELNQNDYNQVAEAYLNSLSTTTEPRQKVFKICNRVEDKVTGRELLVSKYCTVRPKIVKPVMRIGLVRKQTNSDGKGNYEDKKSERNDSSMKNTGVPEKNAFENSIAYINDKNQDNFTKSECVKGKSTDKTVATTDTNAMRTLKMHLSKRATLRKTVDIIQNEVNSASLQKNSTEISENKDSTKGNPESKIKIIGRNVCHCGKTFKSREQHMEHIRKDHWKPKEFICEDCNKGYKKWRDYSRHKCNDSKHIKGFVCGICGKDFESETSLHNHTSNTKKKRSCKNCDKVFCYFEDLASHMKDHLKFSCKTCSKAFYTKWNLSMHVRNVHTTLKCEYCNKVFMYTKYLKRHIRSQHAKEWFMCNVCGTKFVNKQTYTLHKEKCLENCFSEKTDTPNSVKEDMMNTNIVNNAGRHEKADITNVCENNEYVEKSKNISSHKNKIGDDSSNTHILDTGEISSLKDNNEVLELPDIENEDLALSESSNIAGKLENEDRLIISNTLFRKGDQRHRLRWKRRTRAENEKVKHFLTTKIQKLTSELKMYHGNNVDFKKKLNVMKNKLDKVTRKISATQTSANTLDESNKGTVSDFNDGYVMDQNDVAKIKVEHSDDDKKNIKIDTPSSENNAVIVIESSSESDEEACKASAGYSTKFTTQEEHIENKGNESESGSELEEDDESYEEEIIAERGLKESYIHTDELQMSSNLDTELIKESATNEKEKNFDARSRSQCDELVKHCDARKRKLEMKKDTISSVKLKKASVVLIDIFKASKTHTGKFSEQKVEHNEEVVSRGVYKVDDNLSDAGALCKNTLNSNTFSGNELRSVQFRDGELSDEESSSESASDDDNEGYEECAIDDL